MKKYKKITQLSKNRFLNLFKLDALDRKGNLFEYFFVSRNKTECLKLKTKENRAEGLVIYALLKEDPSKIIMVQQYRYPLDDTIYELPAGLIEAGESCEAAAIREMQEETGMTLEICHEGREELRRPFFMGAGFTDESSCTVFGLALGSVTGRLQEETEWIETIIADKQEVRRILREEKLSVRGAYLLLLFLQSDPEEPFAFLK